MLPTEPDNRTADQKAWDKITEDERHLRELSDRVTAIELRMWDRGAHQPTGNDLLDERDSRSGPFIPTTKEAALIGAAWCYS